MVLESFKFTRDKRLEAELKDAFSRVDECKDAFSRVQ